MAILLMSLSSCHCFTNDFEEPREVFYFWVTCLITIINSIRFELIKVYNNMDFIIDTAGDDELHEKTELLSGDEEPYSVG